MHKIIFAIILITISNTASGQKLDWKEIEKSIDKKKNLIDLDNTIETQKQIAFTKNNFAFVGRCLQAQLQIKDLKTEDTSYFKNSYFLDSILSSNATPIFKSIIHILKAKRLAYFEMYFFYRNDKNLFKNTNGEINYAVLSKEKLDSIITNQYENAKNIVTQNFVDNENDYLWLSKDPLQFFFKPKYIDIIYGEQINYTNGKVISYNFEDNTVWLQKTPDEFLNTADSIKGKYINLTTSKKLYTSWANEHKDDKNAYYFIETLARKFLYNHSNHDTKSIEAYQNYLQNQIASPYNTVKAHAVYQRCLYLNNEAKNYKQNYSNKNDTSYRYHYVKALNLFTQHENMLDSFAYVKDILVTMKEQILSSSLSLATSNVIIPNKIFEIKPAYKNIETIYIKIVKVNVFDTLYRTKENNLKRFNALAHIVEKSFSMPVVADYQEHNSTLKLPALQAGRYYILYSKDAITNSNSNVSYFELAVNNVAVINNDTKVFLLNRITGFPLQNSKVIVKYKNKINATLFAYKKVNDKGFIDILEKEVQLLYIIHDGDTSVASMNSQNENKPSEIYDGEDAEELVDYYKDNMKLQMFTDRSIYRPGQTVFYKGIVTIRNPKNGEVVIMNKKNFKLPFFQKILNKYIKEELKEKPEVYIVDPFNRNVDTIKVKLNEYGSFAGSHKIRADAATGEWEFESDEIDEVSNNVTFIVEEYKRPTFELTINKPTTNILLGEDFTAKINVRSFAGALLGNTKVEYKVTINFNYQTIDSLTKETKYNYVNKTLIDSSGFTNEEGVLYLKFINEQVRKLNLPNYDKYNVRYAIHAEAVDATGESHEEDISFEVSNRPIAIRMSVPSKIEKSEIAPLDISTRAEFTGEIIEKNITIKLFKIEEKVKSNFYYDGDYILNNGNWEYVNPPKYIEQKTEEILIEEKILNSKTDKYNLPKNKLVAGKYKLIVTSKDGETILGETEKSFTLLDKDGKLQLNEEADFHYLPNNYFAAGEELKWQVGNKVSDIFSIYHIAYFKKTKKGYALKNGYQIQADKKGVHKWKYTIPNNIAYKITLTHIYIKDGEIFNKEENITIRKEEQQNEIIVEQYRKILVPGGKEKFVVTVKTKNTNVAAEIMTTMYDASLDKIAEHEWKVPYFRNDFYFRNNWNNDLSQILNGETISTQVVYKWNERPNSGTKNTLYWLNPMDYAYSELNMKGTYTVHKDEDGYVYADRLMGKVPGVTIMAADGLESVVVTGLGVTSSKKLSMSGVSVVMRGISSLSGVDVPLVIIDGVIYSGDLGKISMGNITEALVLKGADATALYGSKAASGVLIISTKGPIVLPKPEPPVVVVRKNFNETAFFFPQVHADAAGFYNFTFTMPESVTEWKWKIFAHTKAAVFTKIERTIYTQLPLMVQPNMPRFLYQGDKIVLQTRITNLDSTNISGSSNCIIEDAVTGENITAQLCKNIKQNFEVQKKSNNKVAYTITVPENLLHPIKIKITARAGSFSDGEEHTIPILSKKILVVQNQQIVFSKNDTTVNTIALPSDASPYGISLYIAPKPQAAVLNALPYLAFYQHNCAEQTFNKLLAHSIATYIMRTDTSMQKMQQAKNKIDNTKDALPDELSEQTMPWLQLNNSVALHKKELTKLLDTLKGNKLIEKYFETIAELQNGDGGISWFKGGKSNTYISNYILEGFGKLKNDKLFFLPTNDSAKYNTLIKNLIAYCDVNFIAYNKYDYNWEKMQFLIARKYHLSTHPISQPIADSLNSSLNKFWKDIDDYDLGTQATLIKASLFYGNEKNNFTSLAKKQLESISQLAINDDVAGVRWKAISNKDDLNASYEETIVAIAEAYETNGDSKATIDGIVKWLLYAKELHNWSTTKSTAGVVGLISRNPTNVTSNAITLSEIAGSNTMAVTDNLLKGNLIDFKQQAFPSTIKLTKDVNDIANAGLNYYYFTATPPIDDIAAGVKISKIIYRLNNNGKEIVTANTVLKIADKLETIITIETAKQLKYVFIDEKRSATQEPKDALSGYQYSKGFSFYQSVRDVGYQFFAEQIPSGISTISYETVVAKVGEFNNGVVSLQCMYKPAVKAYGVGVGLKVE